MLDRHVRVATNAGIRAVSGGGQLGLVDEQRDGFSRRVGFEKCVVRMAIETIAVF
jgi:hypothetical protein